MSKSFKKSDFLLSYCVVDADVKVDVDSDVDVVVDGDDVGNGCQTTFVLVLMQIGKNLLAAALPKGFVELTAETSLLDDAPRTKTQYCHDKLCWLWGVAMDNKSQLEFHR